MQKQELKFTKGDATGTIDELISWLESAKAEGATHYQMEWSNGPMWAFDMDTYEVNNFYYGPGVLLSTWNGYECPAFTIEGIGNAYKGFHQCMKHIVGIGELTLWIKAELDKLTESEKSKLINLLETADERHNQYMKMIMKNKKLREMENGFYKVKDNGKWTVATKADDGWYLPCEEFTMEEAGYDQLEEIGERIVLPDETSDESSGLHLQNVSNRRELFVSFLKFYRGDNLNKEDIATIDMYLDRNK